jgi:hypothetical protein
MSQEKLTRYGRISEQIISSIIRIIITMIILLLDNRAQTIIPEIIIKDKRYVVFPFAEKGFGMVAVLIAVLEHIVAPIFQIVMLVLRSRGKGGGAGSVPVECIRDSCPISVRMVPIFLQPDPVADILTIRIREKFHNGPFPVIWMSRVLFSLSAFSLPLYQEQTYLLKEHIISNPPRIILGTLLHSPISRKRSTLLFLLRLRCLHRTACI